MKLFQVEKRYTFLVAANSPSHAESRVDDPEDSEGAIIADETLSVTEVEQTD